MDVPSLFDPKPEPQFFDARPLGDVKEIFCADDGGVLIFEHGSMRISPDAFFSISRVLSRQKGGQ